MKKRLLWLFILILMISGVVFYVWWPWKADAPARNDHQPDTAKATCQNIHATVLATGKVRPQVGAEVNVGARISGRLERLHVNIGDKIVKGQIISEIEKEDLEATTTEREADVKLFKVKLNALKEKGPREIARAEAELSERQASLKYARAELDRLEQLLGKGAIGKQTWDQAIKQFEVTDAQTEVARKNLQLTRTDYIEGIKQIETELVRAEASLKNATVKLSYAVIKAPISGVIASVSTREGETVAAGLSAPTFVTILDLERLQLNASVDEVDIGRVKVGQEGFFTVDAYPAKEFEGQVNAIYPQAVIQDNVVTYDCVLSIKTPYVGLLRPQMTANVTIIVESRKDVLVLPVKAVKRRSGKSVVYQKMGNRINTVTVITGWQDESLIEITSGLSAGDVVLLTPPDSIKTKRKTP
ncbi:MAG: efflux RND transporter periplasmic adaptor subunit [Deltaproteobacteria bacterium]|nr:efflux RND transporter periplasmic adaptor subunit [Deltaproteobacteria bacterium]